MSSQLHFPGLESDAVVLFTSVSNIAIPSVAPAALSHSQSGTWLHFWRRSCSIPTRPMNEIDPFPARIAGGIKFLKEQFGQLADVLRPEQLDARNR